MKLCLNTRDCFIVVDMPKVMCFQANGNYTQIYYIGGLKVMASVGLSKIEDIVKMTYTEGTCPFVRLGRRYIVNQDYLFQINILKQQLILSDFEKNSYTISIPKLLLKKYRNLIKEKYDDEKD